MAAGPSALMACEAEKPLEALLMTIAPASLSPLRITPMVVLPDIAPTLRRYEALGFERVESGINGCVGMKAGQTALILASVEFMSGDYDALLTDRLIGQTIPYI